MNKYEKYLNSLTLENFENKLFIIDDLYCREIKNLYEHLVKINEKLSLPRDLLLYYIKDDRVYDLILQYNFYCHVCNTWNEDMYKKIVLYAKDTFIVDYYGDDVVKCFTSKGLEDFVNFSFHTSTGRNKLGFLKRKTVIPFYVEHFNANITLDSNYDATIDTPRDAYNIISKLAFITKYTEDKFIFTDVFDDISCYIKR